MKFHLTYRKKILIFFIILISAVLFNYLYFIFTTPGELTLIEGEINAYSIQTPFLVNVKADKEGIINFGNKAEGNRNSVNLSAEKNGSVILKMDLLGLIPLKTVKVDVLSNDKIIACGNTIGVKIKLDGVLVIAISDVDTVDGTSVMPAKDSGIKPGDVIVEVNGTSINSISDLIDEIDNSQGSELSIKYRRGEHEYLTKVKPARSIDDKRYKLGMWVRESTAGIGTLTFYDPSTNWFGALGHGITDIDTGILLPIASGEILVSNILGVKIGKVGNPGELKGVFIEGKNLGTIEVNTEYGIYGKLNVEELPAINNRLYPVGIRANVKEGPATILANISGDIVEEYDIEILKVSRGSLNGSKGMVIRVTDERLLEETGGIVQGMSGSPIIQNNKIIGAVTHVLVNDPTRGYGIFIEGMLRNIRRNDINLGETG
ncbi:MAG TPA: SpoIVB peptidase [Clostridiaceae bacterium]|nr:SpoIVB peptidase [Clostridiaceae bacterium]